jgi:two-component system chemotaxis response regulator CheY
MLEPAPSILVVEDLDDHRELLTQVLLDLGYAVTSAVNGRAALDLLRGGLRPALVLLDLLMPVMDGATFLADLRAHSDPALAGIPVVLMTADPGEVAERIDGAHPDLILAKPFGLKDLRRVVVKFCGQGAGSPRWGSSEVHDLA